MKMKRKTMFCMLSLCLLSAASVNAQVTIGGATDPVAGAILDLNSDVKGGLVLSSIAIEDLGKIPANVLTGITSEQDENLDLRGIMVYNTGTLGVPAGIYVWNGYFWSTDGNCTPIVTTLPTRAFTVRTVNEYADLTVTADGCPRLTYTWYENRTASTTGGVPVSGADKQEYRTSISLPAGTYYYYCGVKSSRSDVEAVSDLFTVTVQYPCTAAPTITAATETEYSVNKNATLQLTVSANGNGDNNQSYQWKSSATGNDGSWGLAGGDNTAATYSVSTGSAGMLHYRCEVSNSCGTSFSDTYKVQVLENTVTDAQNNEYTIGDFGAAGVWMTQNLRSTTSLTLSANPSETNKYYAYPGTSPTNSGIFDGNKEYGLLYNWPAASGRTSGTTDTGGFGSNPPTTHYRGICPEGWHLPSDYEWSQLEKEIATNPQKYSDQMSSYGNYDFTNSTFGWRPNSGTNGTDDTYWGRQMKSQIFINTTYADGSSKACNNNGFDALLVGYAYNGKTDHYGSIARFWSSSAYSSVGIGRELSFGYTGIARNGYNKFDMLSVRCKQN
jgi:uncharacterized protein (TIGR02145 family)